jgi:predicted CxxxxCH...CXXCH cytochrome family protein
VPATNLHADGIVEMAWGPLSVTSGARPSWNATAGTCANTYCHGNHVNGLNATPSWTATGPLSCSTSCHARTPNDSFHTTFRHSNKSGACNGCHKDTDATGSTVTNPALHVNGVIDGLCSQCHKGKVP